MNNKQVAVVTGGNRGMGLKTCEALAEKGFHVVLASRGKSAAIAAAGLSKHGLSVEPFALDVCSQTDREALVAHLTIEHGRLDVLINNAGILIDAELGSPASIMDTNANVVRQTLEVNTIAPMMLIKCLLPLIRKAGYGRIVNLSSGMGQLADMGGQYPGYRISKTALNAVTKIFATEIEGSGITVNAVCPGWVRTDMGGTGADRSLEQGIDTTIWLASLPDNSRNGGFYRDRKLIEW